MWVSDKLHIITAAKMPCNFLLILARMTHLSGLNHYSCHIPFTTVFRLFASVFFCQGCRNIDATDLDACTPHPQAHRWKSIKAARVQTYCNSQTHHTRQGVLVGRRWRNVIINQTKTEKMAAWCETLPFPASIFVRCRIPVFCCFVEMCCLDVFSVR